MGEGAPPLVAADRLRKRFDGVWAVDRVSFDLHTGTILGLIGPNGSGKTTLLNLLNGVHQPNAGTVALSGEPMAGRAVHEFAHHGVMRTFQHARVFSTLSAYENMLVPTLHSRVKDGNPRDRAMELLRFVGLETKWDVAASELSGGQQKLLEFARALITDPEVVLMDEPFAGVHPAIKAVMQERIRERNAEGTAFIIVSHEIPDLMVLAHRVLCMNEGAVIAAGSPEEVREADEVVAAYLGRPSAAGGAR